MKHKWFEYSIGDKVWWFRFYGYGIHCKNMQKYSLLFSERECKYIRGKYCLRIGNWFIGTLKPL